MIDPNYRPSDEVLFDVAMELNKYPHLNMRYKLNPETRQQVLDMNKRDWDDILATMLMFDIDIEHDINL